MELDITSVAIGLGVGLLLHLLHRWFYGPKSDEPLGLSEGSVRAILALGTVGTFLGVTVAYRWTPESLLSLASGMVGYYFGSRTATK